MCQPAVFKVQPNDSILFLGGLNTITGITAPSGFINVFKREVQNKFTNVTFFNGGFAHADGQALLSKLDSILANHVVPTKTIVTVGLEILSSISVSQIRLQMESIVARLLADNVEVILCPLILNGERLDSRSELDDTVYEFLQLNRNIARDYGIMLINLQPQLETFWAHNNIDQLEHSILTLDGKVLNEMGHTFVALALLKALGVDKHDLVADNIVLTEQRRVASVKEDIKRMKKLRSSIEAVVV